ncbi:hypothetical protein CI109_104862 [Kwoniella shandongensis]|uniref:Uncharacterized protein n=1 Tax=Kwoniella shandongensis TaxID=1734106 RepID=A0A5M6BTW6_9TREE|nr:uncharacterized protein CI109_006153 [Kwoniella shandongensis]KAA5525462.1 hypothetical protein CI109_006153 [Kwoniella shandongensis]
MSVPPPLPALPTRKSTFPAGDVPKRANSSSGTSTIPLPPQPPPLLRTKSPAHLPLYRRLLFPLDPVEKIPKIVIGDGEEIETINERLHNLIALTLRAYILSWYTRFTRDRSLLPSIHSTIVHPVLSPILTDVYSDPDRLCEFILLDLPTLLSTHIRTYWEARAAVSVGLEDDIGEAYHARIPLLSVACEDGQYTLSPLYLATLSSALLPPEPKAPDVQRLMVREVLARSVLASVARRLYEPWFWYSLFLKFVGETGDERNPSRSRDEGEGGGKKIDQLVWERVASILSVFWGFWSLMISIMATYTAAPQGYTKRYEMCMEPVLGVGREILGVDGRGGLGIRSWRARLSWSVLEMVVGLFGPILDRLIPHLIHTHILTPRTSLRLIDLLEKLLFPLDGYPGPSPIDPTPAEAADLKRRAERRLGEIIPRPIRIVFCPSQKDVVNVLGPLSNPSCNAHLIGMILDSVIVTLIPDLAIDNPIVSSPNSEAEDGELSTQADKEVIFPQSESPTQQELEEREHELEVDLAEALVDS